MQPKLLKSSQLGEFTPAEFNGTNESGYEPVCDRVLVLPDMAAAKSSGGIELPPEVVDRHTMAAETGIVVAVGPDAFKWTPDKTRPWEGYKPQPGDRVYIQRYSGQVMLGEDGKFYRLMDYPCVGAVKRSAPQSSLLRPRKIAGFGNNGAFVTEESEVFSPAKGGEQNG